jgi:hypothetical protein
MFLVSFRFDLSLLWSALAKGTVVAIITSAFIIAIVSILWAIHFCRSTKLMIIMLVVFLKRLIKVFNSFCIITE